MIQLSVIIVSYNTKEITRNCLQSIRNSKLQLEYEIILVDNASSDGSVQMVREEFPEVRLIANETNNMFAKANNQAMQVAKGNYFLLLNSDTIVKPGNIEKLYTFIDSHQPKVGCVGPLVLNMDGSVQSEGEDLPSIRSAFCTVFGGLIKWLPFGIRKIFVSPGHKLVRERRSARVGWVLGCCFLVPRARFDEFGGLDETFKFYSEEVDFCCQLNRKGYETWLYRDATIFHLGGGSTADVQWGSEMLLSGRILYLKKNHTNFSIRVMLNLYIGYFGVRKFCAAGMEKRVLCGKMQKYYMCIKHGCCN